MARRPGFKREPSDFRRGTLVAAWPDGVPPAEEVARRVRYLPSGEHKGYPDPHWDFVRRSDKAKCDRFADLEVRPVDALRRAILAGCVDEEFRGGFPARVWAFVNGVLHEARLSQKGSGEYHAFPLENPEHWPIDRNDGLKRAPRVTIPVV